MAKDNPAMQDLGMMGAVIGYIYGEGACGFIETKPGTPS